MIFEFAAVWANSGPWCDLRVLCGKFFISFFTTTVTKETREVTQWISLLFFTRT